MTNTYTVINASAGSGKTYTLVQRILSICLRYPNQEKTIGNILALTFTNKAANEMKERILEWLKKFTSPHYENDAELLNLQASLERENILVDIHELHYRAQKLLDYVLHHYSTLNISTIDKFNSRLVRSFSHELGLAQNFNLEIQAEPHLIEAVDQLLDQIGDNEQLSHAFLDFINYNLDGNQRVNLNKTLYDSAKAFINDIHYEALQKNENFDWEHYSETKDKLRREIHILKVEAQDIAIAALDLIKSQGLENGDFAGGSNKSIMYFFTNYLKNGTPKLYPTVEEEENKVQAYLKGASKAGQVKSHLIEEILPTLLEARKRIIQHYILQKRKEKILQSLLPLKVNREIQNELHKIETEKDLVLLSKFNVLINKNLKNEPSEFIYEKIGTRFQHFFFDEFQDTSVMQWQNFVPLRDHTIAIENTSFTLVGDPKQSIYRFRGGESQLMLDIINGNEDTLKRAELLSLSNNFRSATRIVDFNNRLYGYMSKFLKEEHRDIFGKEAIQHPKPGQFEGRIRVNLFENTTKDLTFETMAEKMREDIQECIDNGFNFSDITILCRGNTDILLFSKLLTNLRVLYKGEDTYIRTISESGLTLELSYTLKALIELLKWKTNPKNHQFFVMMMYYLTKTERLVIQDFNQEIFDLLKIEDEQKLIETLKERYALNLLNEQKTQLNLYNVIEQYITELAVPHKETNFILNFLEILYAFTQNAGATVKEFIRYWEEEASKKAIQASENVDAIQIMTIHKSKGLEFPVVFLPFFQKNQDQQFTDWFDVNENALQNVHIKAFEKDFEPYDPEIQEFNARNSYKNQLDRFCLQYVATTRPVEQLFMYIQKPVKTSYVELYDFLFQEYNVDGESFDLYPVTEEQKKKQRKAKDVKAAEVFNLSDLSIEKKEVNNIKIATPSKTYQSRNEKVREGIFTHELLSKINSEKDIEPVLTHYLLQGLITKVESKNIRETLKKLIAKYPLYFGEDLEIENERDIMITLRGETHLHRPDRIIKTPEGWYIVDFKTGDHNPKYEQQILRYETILKQLGHKILKTEIIYL